MFSVIYHKQFYSYVIFCLSLLLAIYIFYAHKNQSLFYAINSFHIIFPSFVWRILDFITYTKYTISAIMLLIITLLFRSDKLLNVFILIIVFYITFFLLKIIIAEPRPYMLLPKNSFYLLIPSYENPIKVAYHSFPSGHVGNITIFILALLEMFNIENKFIKIILWALIPLIAIMRICTGWHWPLDVICSFLIAFMLVKIVLNIRFAKAKS